MPYQNLAFHYDALMRNVDYGAYADYLLALTGKDSNALRVLDLACGTGRLAEALCRRGCDVAAADSSPEMLSVAQERACGALFVQQDMAELDLYGTVEAAFCTLDALNYLTDERQLKETFRRIKLFLEPGGVFAFDLLTPEALAARDGAVYYSDAEDCYCVWRCAWAEPLLNQEVTLFARQDGGLWKRSDETHTERAYRLPFIEGLLLEAGFTGITRHKPPFDGGSRVVFSAR
jgi:SAM-dependent methyltransferase